MNTKEYLENIRALDLLIESSLRQEETLRARLTATEAHLSDGMPRLTSPDPDKISAVVAEIIDLQNERNANIDRFVDMKAGIKDAVKLLPYEERVFIESYYFGHMGATDIGRKLNMSRRSVYNLRDRAIERLDKSLHKLHTCIS